MKNLILDLQNNGGGYLKTAVDLVEQMKYYLEIEKLFPLKEENSLKKSTVEIIKDY